MHNEHNNKLPLQTTFDEQGAFLEQPKATNVHGDAGQKSQSDLPDNDITTDLSKISSYSPLSVAQNNPYQSLLQNHYPAYPRHTSRFLHLWYQLLQFDHGFKQLVFALSFPRDVLLDEDKTQSCCPRLWIRERGAPLRGSEHQRARAVRIDAFFEGIAWVTEWFWPVAFYTLLAHDVGVYLQYPNRRYGATLAQLFLGTIGNDVSLTNRLHQTWAYNLAWVSSMFALGLWEVMRRWSWHQLDQPSHLLKVDPLLLIEAGYWRDVLCWVTPCYNNWGYNIVHAETHLLWKALKGQEDISVHDSINNKSDNPSSFNENITTDERLQTLLKLVNHTQGLTRMRLMRALANFVLSRDDRLLKTLHDAPKILEKQFRTQALSKLSELSQRGSYDKAPSWQQRLYAYYWLWKTGYLSPRANLGAYDFVQEHGISQGTPPTILHSLGLQGVFWSGRILIGYAKVRMWLMFALFIRSYIVDYIQRRQCESQHKLWLYVPQIGQKRCLICPDWQEVYINDLDNATACLEGRLSVQHTADTVLAALQRVQYFGVKSFDLSHQSWFNWTLHAWQNVLQQLAMASDFNMTSFNLSAPFVRQGVRLSVPNTHVTALIDCFETMISLLDLDLSDLQLSALQTQTLLMQIARMNASLISLEVSGNYLEEVSFQALKAVLGRHPVSYLSLNRLLRDANTRSNLAKDVVATLSSSHVQHLSISYNQWSHVDFEILGYLPTTTKSIDFSGNIAFGYNLTALGRLNLTCIIAVGMQLDDTAWVSWMVSLAQYFASSLQSCDVSDNQLTEQSILMIGHHWSQFSRLRSMWLNHNALGDEGFAALMQFLSNSSLLTLGVSHNLIGDTGLIVGSRYLPKGIFSLDMSYNQMTEVGLSNLKNVLINLFLKELYLNHNAIGNTGLLEIARWIRELNYSIHVLDAASNGLTSQGLSSFFNTFNNKTFIDYLNLSDNQLTDLIVSLLISGKLSSRSLGLANIGLTEAGFEPLANHLNSMPSLQSLILDENDLGSSAGNLLTHLVSSVPNLDELTQNSISQDLAQVLSKAHPETGLTSLSMQQCNIHTDTARLLCRLVPQTAINIKSFHIANNPIDPSNVRVAYCQVSHAERVEPDLVFWTVATTYLIPQGIKSLKTLCRMIYRRLGWLKNNVPTMDNPIKITPVQADVFNSKVHDGGVNPVMKIDCISCCESRYFMTK